MKCPSTPITTASCFVLSVLLHHHLSHCPPMYLSPTLQMWQFYWIRNNKTWNVCKKTVNQYEHYDVPWLFWPGYLLRCYTVTETNILALEARPTNNGLGLLLHLSGLIFLGNAAFFHCAGGVEEHVQLVHTLALDQDAALQLLPMTKASSAVSIS